MKTKGPGWFNMKAPELTEEAKRDLEVLQMRSVLDPKRHYKNDMKVKCLSWWCKQQGVIGVEGGLRMQSSD